VIRCRETIPSRKGPVVTLPANLDAEWLEADGLGGFASGTVSTRRTRRYHAWLLSAKTPPTERYVLVNGGDVWIECAGQREFFSSQHYAPDVITPGAHVESFSLEPWPTWTLCGKTGARLRQEILSLHEQPTTILRWTILETPDQKPIRLCVRPFFSGRDYHATHHENPAFRFEPQRDGDTWTWHPYPGVPAIRVQSDGIYEHQPAWYRQFLYIAERERGLDDLEDLASPGVFAWELSQESSGVLCLSAEGTALDFSPLSPGGRGAGGEGEVTDATSERARNASEDGIRRERQERRSSLALRAPDGPVPDPLIRPSATFSLQGRREEAIRAEWTRRMAFATPLHRAADAYVVRRGTGRTLIAGYPWFTDWGRDTFISLRGLCLSTRRFELAEEILRSWAPLISEGMLPNRFPDAGQAPEYNAVDASLWYVIAVAEFLKRYPSVSATARKELEAAARSILQGYARGTRFQIRMDHDGLIAAGVPSVQLTWMDAKLGDWVVTPRIGKPVEVQALWLNALHAFRYLSSDFESWFRQGRDVFQRRFWNPAKQCLFDVIDADHEAGRVDDSVRANQIFAVGGLPLNLLPKGEARQTVELVQRELLTPWGLRTLSPLDRNYHGYFHGDPKTRDAAYHQGTVWPWLMGAFVEAWLRVRGETSLHRRLALMQFVQPFEAHLQSYGLGHLAEVADGDLPHQPGGCPFQAWSLAEILRLKFDVLGDSDAQQKLPLDGQSAGATLRAGVDNDAGQKQTRQKRRG
jgi:glycogen debranching enzyme